MLSSPRRSYLTFWCVYVSQQTAISGSESTAVAQANGESVTAAATPALVRPGECHMHRAEHSHTKIEVHFPSYFDIVHILLIMCFIFPFF